MKIRFLTERIGGATTEIAAKADTGGAMSPLAGRE
jgi:hypothetical protein